MSFSRDLTPAILFHMLVDELCIYKARMLHLNLVSVKRDWCERSLKVVIARSGIVDGRFRSKVMGCLTRQPLEELLSSGNVHGPLQIFGSARWPTEVGYEV